MTVVLVPIIATYGPHGVLVVGLLAGLILIGLGYAGAGQVHPLRPDPGRRGLHRRHRGDHRAAAGAVGPGRRRKRHQRRGARADAVRDLAAGPGLGTARDGDGRGAARGGAGARAAALAGRPAGGGGRGGRQLRVRLGGRLDRSHPLAAPGSVAAVGAPRRAGAPDPAGARRGRTGRAREPAVGHGRRRDERGWAARLQPRAGRAGSGQPRGAAVRRHPRHGRHRADGRQRALRRLVATGRAHPLRCAVSARPRRGAVGG